jgi:acyl carrier protein
MNAPTFEGFCARTSEHLDVGIPDPSVLFDARLEEYLGFDSILRFELLLFVEDWAGVQLPEALLPQLVTLGDVYSVLATRITQEPRDPANGSRA